MIATRAIIRAMIAAAAAATLGSGCGSNGVSSANHPGPGQRSFSPVGTGAPPSATPEPAGTPKTEFEASISVIDSATRARMRYTWRPGCPVPLGDLRLLGLTYFGFDGRPHSGEIVVNRDVVHGVISVFRTLFAERFPIRRMVLVDAYQGDDERSMAADNTSGFNCRWATGHPGVWSEHSYGRAIDVDPLENPYVAPGGEVSPPGGARFADRSLNASGMIHAGDGVVRAFAAIGWGWGGSWTSFKDYQHFSSNGR